MLDSYSPERTAVGETVLRNATRLTDIGTLAKSVAQVARAALGLEPPVAEPQTRTGGEKRLR